MTVIFEYKHEVEAQEIDGQGHVNNLEYLKWMQAAAIAHSTAQGWPPDRYQESGAGWVVRSHEIEYQQPAFVRTRSSDGRQILYFRNDVIFCGCQDQLGIYWH